MHVPLRLSRRRDLLSNLALFIALGSSLAGCASLPMGGADSVAAAAAAGAAAASESSSGRASHPGASANDAARVAAAAAAAAVAGQQRPFADVVRDAKELPGLVNVWQKDDKVFIEIEPSQFDKPYFLVSSLNQGIGEQRLYGGMMSWPAGVEQVVVFHKHGPAVQLIAKNVKYTAKENTPEARAVANGFSDSLLATAPVVAQPHPERKSVLIDASALFLTDMPAAAQALERSFHQPYGFDPRNSSIGKVRATPEMVTLDVSAHYAVGRLAVASSASPHAPTVPSAVPDPRSLFLGFHYSLAALPEHPMHPRPVDERIGHFWVERVDFSNDVARVPIQRYVARWRLEKKDPSAALSEPKQPIVYTLDRTIPERYREAVREGILEWNKAFEKIGFKDAIKVEQQPDDADYDTSDLRRASVRWITNAHSSFVAIGPRVVDPRSGEILDADIAIDGSWMRVFRNLRSETLPPPTTASEALSSAIVGSPNSMMCEFGSQASEQAGFGMALLEARGELNLDGPDAERFLAGLVKETVMHEVGHTLGLTHNFRASTVYTDTQLADSEFTRSHGLSGSVMDYNPWNIALKGQRQGEFQMSTLGPYDYWAIEYAYADLAPEHETEGLAKIAERSTEPLLAFSMDDTSFYSGLDPEINQFDLTSDPLGYAQKRFALARELLDRTERRELKEGESYSVLRRNLVRGLADAQESAAQAVKYVGGLTLLRDRAGTGRPPMMPVAPEKQRAALDLVLREVLSADSFRIPPKLLREASVSFYDQLDAEELGRPLPPLDFAIDQRVLGVQRVVLNQLLSEQTAQRLVNNATRVDSPSQSIKLSELYTTLHAAIWSELRSGRDINLFRRNLQREHASRIATALLKPAATMPADARALMRDEAKTLRQEIATAQAKRSSYSKEARAHLAEVAAELDEALKAPIIRQGV